MQSSRCRQAVIVLPLLLSFALAALPACATITLGADARAVAMGGAGLASGDSPQNSSMNPATLAATGSRFAIQWPSITTHAEGASYSDALKLLGSPSLSGRDALDLAIDLGTKLSRIDASATAGFLLPKIDVQAEATIRTEIVPNAAFMEWAKGDQSELPAESALADVYAGGIATLPSVGVGFYLPVDEETTGRISVGVRVKPTTAYYSHYVINDEAISAGKPLLAEEMGNKDYLRQSSFSADLGIMYTPAAIPNAHVALVVNNLIEPKAITFAQAAPSGLYGKQLAPRSISAGAAVVGDHATLAADLVDLTGAYGDPQLRLGGEVRTKGGLFALRGGYNSALGFTAGIGIGGFGVAYSKNTPIMLSHSISF